MISGMPPAILERMDEVSTVCLDAHVHLYPLYRSDEAIASLFRNLGSWTPRAGGSDKGRDALAPVCRVAILAESRRCHAFREIRAQGCIRGTEGLKVAPTESYGVAITAANGDRLHLLAGRQVVTRERIEILALTVDAAIPDGLSADETLAAVKQAEGVSVVSWAPGKWLGGRGRVVRSLIERYPPAAFLLGDSSLRPTVWSEPLLMRRGRRRGFAIVAGSDPLPFAGEERRAGTYGCVYRGPFDDAHPVSSMRRILTERPSSLRLAGRRSGPFEVALRLMKNARSKSAAGPGG